LTQGRSRAGGKAERKKRKDFKRGSEFSFEVSELKELEGVEIEDTFAEAFPIKVARVLITAVNEKWALNAAKEATGFGTSVIMCPVEAGIERTASPEETPDGRPGVFVLFCAPSYKTLEEQLLARLGQCVLTAPTAAAFNALSEEESVKTFNTGFKLKFFGDGFEKVGELYGRKVSIIPIMGGEFIVEQNFGAKEGVAGGNFFILAENMASALLAAENAVAEIEKVDGVITPFPGGIVSSGSKPGSLKYKFMHATTNHKFCPTLKGVVEDSEIPDGVNAVLEIVINGLSEDAVKEAMRKGIKAAVKVKGVKKITAGNYGGTLGKYHLKLHEILGL